MRIIFLLYHGFSESSGISTKILCQIKALRELGHRVNVCTYDMNKNRHRVRMMDEEIIEDYGTGKWAAVRKRISYDGIYRYAVTQEVNMIYVRSFHNANPFTVRLFYRLQKAGITHLKLVGRGNHSEDMKADIQNLHKSLTILKTAGSEAEYCRQMKQQIFPGGCSRQCCYR